MGNVNRKNKITATERVLQSMITENTGRAMCDSGGAYGRHWENNQGRTFENESRSTLDFKYGLSVGHNVYTWLCDKLVYNAEIQRKFDGWSRRKANENMGWTEAMETYVAHVEGKGIYGDGEPFTVNSYNGEDLLSQVIQYVYWTDEDGAHVLLQIHGGCDVRGGYTRPRAFDVYDDTSIFDNAHAAIFCTGKPSKTPQRTLPLDGDSQDEEVCGASWWTDDAYHYYDHAEHDGTGHDSHLEAYDQVKLEADQDPVAAVEARKVEGLPRAIHVDSEGHGYCPFCGALLAADFS